MRGPSIPPSHDIDSESLGGGRKGFGFSKRFSSFVRERMVLGRYSYSDQQSSLYIQEQTYNLVTSNIEFLKRM